MLVSSTLSNPCETVHNIVARHNSPSDRSAMGGDEHEAYASPPTTHRSPPQTQMSFMKHQGLSHTRSHLLKELRSLNVTAKELAIEGHSLSALQATGYTLKECLNAGFSLEECKEALRPFGHPPLRLPPRNQDAVAGMIAHVCSRVRSTS